MPSIIGLVPGMGERDVAGISMKFPRRKFLHLAAGAAALSSLTRVAYALDYPTRPVRILVGAAPGGANDILARLLSQWLSQQLAQQFFVENRPGAGTNIATEAVVRAPSDGYMLLFFPTAAAINATLYERLGFNFLRDIVPIAGVARLHFVMVVEPSLQTKTVAEFIAYAQANPGKLSMASPGSGTGPQMAGELFKIMAAVDLVTVQYRGDAPALTDLLARQVQVYFSPAPSALELIRAGKLRALAVASTNRLDALPEIPTVGETLPGYEASGFLGFGAPKNTPAEIVYKLNREINAGLADSKIKERIAQLGSIPMSMTSAEFSNFIAAETEKWAKVIRAAKIKLE
jgi:tripartite-type tricarboxylate transporter receptor subunit TctC